MLPASAASRQTGLLLLPDLVLRGRIAAIPGTIAKAAKFPRVSC
jgi:hypothetical protein